MVRQLQEYYCEGRHMATNFKFHPDFEILAKAYGIPAYTFRTEQDVVKGLPEVLEEPRSGTGQLHYSHRGKRPANGTGRQGNQRDGRMRIGPD